MKKLGVNIDHVATLRQARGTVYPDPVRAAQVVEQAGADGLTLHLREDRRHIQDADVIAIAQQISIPVNLEMANTAEMVAFARRVRPAKCCLVPEKREELTTEGGLDVVGQLPALRDTVQCLSEIGIEVSLFIDPSHEMIHAAKEINAPVIELHTGAYAEAGDATQQKKCLAELHAAADLAEQLGLQVNAGHGLHYENVVPIAQIPNLVELNIGHAIIAQAVFVGLESAVAAMCELLEN